jgi:protein-histidine pros-kinase
VAPPALGWADRLRRLLQRLRRGPDTLFGRLACLLAVVVVASHLLALSLMFELRGPPPPRHSRRCRRSRSRARP